MSKEMGLDYLMRKYILSPLEQNKWIFWTLPATAICFQIPWVFPDFPSPFQISLVIHKIPWLFPDLEKILFSRYFSLIVATLRFFFFLLKKKPFTINLLVLQDNNLPLTW